MTGRSCGICGGGTAAGARFCGHCGAPLDATVVSLDREPDAGPRTRGRGATDRHGVGRSANHDRTDRTSIGDRIGGRTSDHRSDRRSGPSDSDSHVVTSRRPSRLLVGAVVALLAVGAIALIAADGGDDDAAPLARPTPGGILRNDAPRPAPSATPTERPTATPRPSPTAVARPAPIDSGDLPPMEATHVAVIGEDTLEFLDLRTGIWAVSSGWSSRPVDARAVRGGAVVQADDGSWVFASADGGEVTVLFDGASGFAFVGGEVIVTVAFDGGTIGDLEAYRFDGTVAWTTPLPSGAWPVGVTRDGQVILQLAERIVALDRATGTPRAIATGSGMTAFDDSVVLWSCDEQLRCATSQLDMTTGATTVISEQQLWFERAGSGRFIGYPQDGGEPQPFAIVEGVLTEIDDDLLANAPTNPARLVADPSGVSVELGRHPRPRHRRLSTTGVKSYFPTSRSGRRPGRSVWRSGKVRLDPSPSAASSGGRYIRGVPFSNCLRGRRNHVRLQRQDRAHHRCQLRAG